ncbi:VIT family protein [Salinicola sp. LHM]|uniref:VIT1/CCC1 transporter family protein n=1 Tax=Salinicola sp. LHM TaxID=3065298 RepID=UPI002ACE8F73|nr:VIT family protein [Salinicola sp. LHM]MEC8918579.1 VIT family protein [Pseudomonadota bacterium]MED5500374.1 VIT family protein [Pseudomonadota bacterium]WQH33209.1 VIT family protein [Salinicola sp. LHM]
MSIPKERHYSDRVGWLRAAVLGANDGIVSTASLVIGMATAGATLAGVLTAGAAGAVAGAMSMAAGEYVSVSSQKDTERADLARERRELAANYESETRELAEIYEARGLSSTLAQEVAEKLMHHDALAAHARDELGFSHVSEARPLQAAMASALTFLSGAALPIVASLLAPRQGIVLVVAIGSLLALGLLGILSAKVGGSRVRVAVVRVVVWGVLAMAATAGVGWVFGVVGT